MFLRFLVTLGLMVLFAGCLDPIELPDDAGPDEGVPSARQIRLVSPLSLELVFGEVAEFEVRYTDDSGEPISGARVDFALEGTAHDSSLGALDGTTDLDGVARGSVIAGNTTTTFRLRVSAEAADDVSLPVAVSDTGFGSLEVEVGYIGEREIAGYSLRVFARASCSDDVVQTGRGDRVMRLPGEGERSTFLALPAEVAYAIVARAEGLTGVAQAFGCEEGVAIVADEEARLRIELVDLPLRSTGAYAADLSLDTQMSAETLADNWSRLGAESLASRGGEVATVLDGIAALLVTDGSMSDSARLERRRDSLRLALAPALVAEDVGPLVAIDAMAELLRTSTQRTNIEGGMRLDVGATGVAYVVRDIFVESEDGLTRRMPSVEGLVSEINASLINEGESLLIEDFHVTLPMGTFAQAVMRAAATERDFGTTRDMFVESAGCDRIATTLSTMVELSCGPDCLSAGCRSAMEGLFAELDESLLTLDAIRDEIRVNGIASLADEDGDLQVDQVLAEEMSGGWYGVEEWDPIVATLRATRSRLP